MPPKIPVSVSAEFKARVEAFVGDVRTCISPPASSAVNNSTVCHVAIEEMLERYESSPDKMACKLGFLPSRRK
jgi:hypothetical protein